MKKLDFLTGNWTGEAKVTRGPGEPLEILQTEEVSYKMDGLLLLIEGTGRSKAGGKVVFRALATITYDDTAGAYRMNAFNDGRYIVPELKLVEKGLEWRFAAGPAKVRYELRINVKGEWTEVGHITMGDQPPRKFVELAVRRQ
jgi:hypothetical protein